MRKRVWWLLSASWLCQISTLGSEQTNEVALHHKDVNIENQNCWLGTIKTADLAQSKLLTWHNQEHAQLSSNPSHERVESGHKTNKGAIIWNSRSSINWAKFVQNKQGLFSYYSSLCASMAALTLDYISHIALITISLAVTTTFQPPLGKSVQNTITSYTYNYPILQLGWALQLEGDPAPCDKKVSLNTRSSFCTCKRVWALWQYIGPLKHFLGYYTVRSSHC